MFILDDPYVSNLLKETIEKNRYKVSKNNMSLLQKFSDEEILFDNTEMVQEFNKNQKIYSNSENSIELVLQNLSFSKTSDYINFFKNKFVFREKIKELYPYFYYQKISLKELKNLDIKKSKKPFIIKPTIGFLSMGVYTVFEDSDWNKVVSKIQEETKNSKDIFPIEVVNTNEFIIEEYIEGEEYAFDAYYTADGKPVILNVFKHIFSSSKDVSDRLYITSDKIINKYQLKFKEFLEKISNILDIKNFPVHVEVRVSEEKIIPIEVNPMRFAGWCTSDLAYYAYGINPYEYFMEEKEPEWEKILGEKEGKIYSIIVLDKPKKLETSKIKSFNYDKLGESLEKILDIRKIDIKKYPLFGFVFAETREKNYQELEKILKDDFMDFIEI